MDDILNVWDRLTRARVIVSALRAAPVSKTKAALTFC